MFRNSDEGFIILQFSVIINLCSSRHLLDHARGIPLLCYCFVLLMVIIIVDNIQYEFHT